MDWLTFHDAIVNCWQKFNDLGCKNDEIIQIESSDLNGLPAMISTMKIRNYVKKGFKAYLAYVLYLKVNDKKVESVPVVCEFSDVFLEELLGLPPIREVKFEIELVLWTTLISIASYRMTLTELKKIKVLISRVDR